MGLEAHRAYETLGLDFDAPTLAIKKAYRELALHLHPDKCPNDPEAEKKFNEIQKAYKLLLAFQKEKLRQNVAAVAEVIPKTPASIITPTQQPPPNEVQLMLTLEEINSGCTRWERIQRRITNADGSEQTEDVVVEVPVKAGSIPGTRITVEKQGDRLCGMLPANVLFLCGEKPHKLFQRDKFDLVYKMTISAKDAIFGVNDLAIPTLEPQSNITISVPGVIKKDTVHVVPNRGLPCGDGRRGALKVKFEIVYELPQDPPIEHQILVPLQHFVTGIQKQMRITRTIVDASGNKRSEIEVVVLDIKPGTEPGAKFVFPKMGDRYPGVVPADDADDDKG